uniref:Uncharacterized protein n=1 Tax=Molossus molossus TaxID=27622 RepID=A0A7J8CS14_MOLMO|nr:hypothetical protein HJG59_009814 [Molossus molossus]
MRVIALGQLSRFPSQLVSYLQLADTVTFSGSAPAQPWPGHPAPGCSGGRPGCQRVATPVLLRLKGRPHALWEPAKPQWGWALTAHTFPAVPSIYTTHPTKSWALSSGPGRKHGKGPSAQYAGFSATPLPEIQPQGAAWGMAHTCTALLGTPLPTSPVAPTPQAPKHFIRSAVGNSTALVPPSCPPAFPGGQSQVSDIKITMRQCREPDSFNSKLGFQELKAMNPSQFSSGSWVISFSRMIWFLR